MAKPELGLKRVCVACGAKFYDMTRQPAVCPKCGAEQPAEQPRPRRAAPLPEDKVKKRASVPAEADPDAEDADLEDAEADPALDEDAEDEDEAVVEEIEVEPDRDEEV
jgi:predicted  nucleic acid-binding Zn-ribbon protein